MIDVTGWPEELRARLGRVNRVDRPQQGDVADLVLVEGATGRFAVKRGRGSAAADSLRREYEALLALEATRLPVPRAHALLPRATPAGDEAWLLMDALPGETVEATLAGTHELAARRAVLAAFGHALRAIHATPTPGPLRGGGGAWLDRMLRDAEANLAAGGVDGTVPLLERLRRERPGPAAATLIHGDYTIDNVLVADGRVTGLIDWSEAAEGDPRCDLALATRPKPAAFRDPADLDAFYAGYGTAPLPEPERAYFVNLYEFF